MSFEKTNMRLLINDQLQSRPYLAPYSHNSAWRPTRSSEVNDFHL